MTEDIHGRVEFNCIGCCNYNETIHKTFIKEMIEQFINEEFTCQVSSEEGELYMSHLTRGLRVHSVLGAVSVATVGLSISNKDTLRAQEARITRLVKIARRKKRSATRDVLIG